MKSHIMLNHARTVQTAPEIFKAAKTNIIQHQGPFTLHMNLPGYNVPRAVDHGYGPLALIVAVRQPEVIQSAMAIATASPRHEGKASPA